MAQYARTTTIDVNPGGDSGKQGFIDLDTDLTGIVAAYNAHDAATTSVHGFTGAKTGSGAMVGATSPTLITPLIDHIDEATSAHGVVIDGVTLKDGGALVITGGTNTFNITNGTASLDVAAGKAVNIDDDVTVAAELHVEAATHVNQDLTSDASPTFAGVNTAAITAPSNSLVIKPTTDATMAVQVQDKDGNAILTVDTTNDRVGIGTTSPTSPLHGAGATSLGYTTITSSGTAGNYTTYFLNASSGEVILTLPAAATYAGRIYHIVRVQTYPSAYNCIVACQSGEYINGEASLALENNYDRVTAQSNGTGWIILGR